MLYVQMMICAHDAIKCENFSAALLMWCDVFMLVCRLYVYFICVYVLCLYASLVA